MVPELEHLVAIPSLDLGSVETLPFDLFVKLPVSSRVILYRREGSALEPEKFDKVSSRELIFFVARENYERYLEYATREFMDLISRHPADPVLMRETAAKMLGNAFAQATSEDAQILVHNMGDLVSHLVHEISTEGADSRGKLFSKFAKLAQTGTDFQRHPLHVASLTVMLTVGLGFHDHRTLIEVGLAALLHDVGLTQLPMSVIGDAHRFRELGTVSRALLKLHPQGSVDLLRSRGIQVSKLMESMISQHHEEFNGQGYPLGLVGSAVHPLAQVLFVADELDSLLAETEPGLPIDERVRGLFSRFQSEQSIEPSLLKKLKALVLES